MKAQLITALFALATVFAVQAATSNDDIKNRIKPLGQVHVAGAEAAAPAGAKSGEDIYNGACVACHGAGVLGAPKNQSAEWKPRLAERGMEGIWKNAINGINAMPPMGTCGSCSEDDIMAAIEYMTEGQR